MVAHGTCTSGGLRELLRVLRPANTCAQVYDHSFVLHWLERPYRNPTSGDLKEAFAFLSIDNSSSCRCDARIYQWLSQFAVVVNQLFHGSVSLSHAFAECRRVPT